MQKRRNFKEKLIASLLVFMMMFSNFATLGTALISYAADAEDVVYSVQFVEIKNEDEDVVEEQPETEVKVEEVVEQVEEVEIESTEEEQKPIVSIKDTVGTATNLENQTVENTEESVEETEIQEEVEVEETETEVEEVPESTEETTDVTVEEPEEEKETQIEEGLALEITVGVKNGGYLKNAKVEIKDLANQIFRIKENVSLGEYIQSIDENKIKLKQIDNGTEIKIYIPIELKSEASIDMKKVQEGVEVILNATHVDAEGNEEIITKTAKPVINVANNVNLVIGSSIEKCIPYVKEGINEALVQLRVTAGSETQNELPIKDTTYNIGIPKIDGVEIKDVKVSAISTAYTNGLSDSDVVFTAENWSYQDGVVTISVDNVEKDGKYLMNSGNDEYIISYVYSNCPDLSETILKANVGVKSNIFVSTDVSEITNTIEKEYDLSQANSNIITYGVTGKTQNISKGYFYANANSEVPEYEVEFENAFNVNVSRVDLIKTIEIRESAEYFQDVDGNMYSTSTENGNNTYYKSVKLNKENLLSIIGETGSFELLMEDGTSLIQINKDTADDGDGYITISFGENKIDKILMRINNPVGEGILNIGTIKLIDKTTYAKNELMYFTSLNNEYIAAAELTEGIITEMGSNKITTNFVDTVTNATISLSRTELSTLVENEDIEISISLNNALATSDMYKNPVFELTLPEEVEEVSITDINLLYGNDELEIANVETLRKENNQVVIRVTLNGTQTKYTLGDSEKGTTIILKTNMTVNMYKASKDTEILLNYYNEDATNYALSGDWTMMATPSAYMLIGKEGNFDTLLRVVAPEGFVNAQMISNYKEDKSIISVNQGRKGDSIEAFAEAKTAEMKMVLINNTTEQMNDVHILGRTIFNGNKSIISEENLGTNQDAPMVSEIVSLEGNMHNATIYYSENGEATDDLEESSNGWTIAPEDLTKVKSYLIVIEGTVEIGDVLTYSYNFEIPANLANNLDLCGTFGTYYVGTETKGIGEADKVVLSTEAKPELKVETIADTDEGTAVEGQRIKYTVKVTNEGKAVSEGIVVNSIIPAGTTYVENGELKPDVTELKIEIGAIKPGKSEEATYEVEVDEDVPEQTYIETNNSVEAEGLETPIYTNIEPVPVQTAKVKIELEAERSGKIVEEESEIYYTTHVVNTSGETLTNCKVVQFVPEGVEFVEAYVEGFKEDGITSYRESEGVYDAASRTVTWNVNSIRVFKTFKLTVKTNHIEEVERNLVSVSRITADGLDKEYSSNEVTHTLARPQIDVKYYSDNGNKYIKEGDTINYILELVNNGKTEATKIDIANHVPSEFRVTYVQCNKNGTSYPGLASENVGMAINLAPGETAKVVMSCTAQNLSNAEDEKVTGNSWTISGAKLGTATTSVIENIVQQNPSTTNNTYENMVVDTQSYEQEIVNEEKVFLNTKTEEVKEEQVEENRTYRIIGKAFNDLNQNAQRDDDEEGMANIVAKLCDAESQEVISQSVTNNIGEYIFEDVNPGEYYIKFEYDSTKYQLSDYQKEGVNSDRNSDAIISNYKAVTDKINVTDTSISDIDIGLIRAGIFDLTIDATINKVTVQNDDETNVYEMENPKLAKVDINPKYANSSKVFIEYTINVTNKGEIAGYAKRLVDYLPEELTLDTTLNPNWYVAADGNAYTQELENVLIQPGETKTVTLVLTKQMTEEDTGIINNTFEIAQTYNEYAISDIDSTEGNNAQGEDDMSRADIILGVQTGGSMINVMIISTTLITLLITLYVIKIRIDNKNKEVIV